MLTCTALCCCANLLSQHFFFLFEYVTEMQSWLMHSTLWCLHYQSSLCVCGGGGCLNFFTCEHAPITSTARVVQDITIYRKSAYIWQGMHLKVMFFMNHPKHERWGHKKFHNVPLLDPCRKILSLLVTGENELKVCKVGKITELYKGEGQLCS